MIIDIQNHFDALESNYLLVVTSNSKEKDAINKIISNRQNLSAHISTSGCSIGLLDGVFVIHLTGSCGLSSEHSASRLIVEFINRNNFPVPGLVYLVGFCWGNPKSTNIGDTVIANTINSLNMRVMDRDQVKYKGIQFRSSIDLEYISKEITSRLPNSKLGVLASLETFLSSTLERDKLLEQYPDLIGGEMEAFGFIPSLKEIPWIIIKTVSDFGCDDIERSSQTNSAAASASVLPNINKLLIKNELIAFSISKPNELFLLDFLVGDEITVLKKGLSPDELNDYLNDEIGIIVERKLEYYLNNDGYDKSFLRYFCDLILEIFQNSLKHGGATYASVKFNNNMIVIHDDGGNFQLENIDGEKGGASAWKRFKSFGIDTNIVEYSFKKKGHYFEMKVASKELLEAILNCKATVIPSTIGSAYGRQVALKYNKGCEIIYLEDCNIRMTSRRITLISEVKRLLEEGKKVYVKVSDNAYAEEYKLALKEYSDNLRILTQ